MLNKKLISLAIVSAIGFYANTSHAVAIDRQAVDQTLMREAAEGPRGADNERPGDRQHRGGRHGVTAESAAGLVIAREANELPRGADKNHPRGHGLTSDSASNFVIAREASEGPRGADNERPGDRQHRGGRAA